MRLTIDILLLFTQPFSSKRRDAEKKQVKLVFQMDPITEELRSFSRLVGSGKDELLTAELKPLPGFSTVTVEKMCQGEFFIILRKCPVFQSCLNKKLYSELLNIAQFYSFIPNFYFIFLAHNANLERMLSLMQRRWSTDSKICWFYRLKNLNCTIKFHLFIVQTSMTFYHRN